MIDERVDAGGPPGERLHGERRVALPPDSVFAPTLDHLGSDLDATVTVDADDLLDVDLTLVRHALVHLYTSGGDPGAAQLPSIQTTTLVQHCQARPGVLRFVGHGIAPGLALPQAVLLAVAPGG
jgi:hypothetical protein